MALQPLFLPATPGQRFALFHSPDATTKFQGAVLYVHPFAEEMNKSRRMAALQARAMAASGYAVLQVDLLGCGDSSGDFADATWEAWCADIEQAVSWMRQRVGGAPLWLWGLRTGCLLVNEVANRLQGPVNLLFWQPVLSGRQFLQQFLRLKAAAEMLSNDGKGVMDRLRSRLQQGESVEVAGYMLSSVLAGALEKSDLLVPHRSGCVEWIEINSRSDASLSPAAISRLTQWQAAGQCVQGTVVNGPAFWQTAEISECSDLIQTSLWVMSRSSEP